MRAFVFAAWRRPGGPLVRRPLLVLRAAVSDDGDYLPRTIHRVTALLSRDETRAVLARPSTLPPDLPGLADEAAALAPPLVVTTARFGELRLSHRLGRFEGRSTWLDAPVEVALEATSEDELRALLVTADALWSEQARWSREVARFAATALLPLKNDAWLDEGEAPVSVGDFEARLRLRSVVVEPGGAFAFWYADGGLFSGHSIEVRGTLARGPVDADIVG